MDEKMLNGALVKRLANLEVSDNAVNELTQVLLRDPRLKPIDTDICTLGICTDHVVDKDDLADFFRIVRDQDFGNIRVFPIGIIAPDSYRVRIEHVLNRRG